MVKNFCWQIQTVYKDGREVVNPWVGTFEAAHEHCANQIANDSENLIYSIVLHHGDWTPGTIATHEQIAGDYQDFEVPGSVRWVK